MASEHDRRGDEMALAGDESMGDRRPTRVAGAGVPEDGASGVAPAPRSARAGRRGADADQNTETPPERKPPFITTVEIENFKGIGRPVRVELRPITLLFGRNSAGKSTVLHALCYAHEILSYHNVDAHRTDLAVAPGGRGCAGPRTPGHHGRRAAGAARPSTAAGRARGSLRGGSRRGQRVPDRDAQRAPAPAHHAAHAADRRGDVARGGARGTPGGRQRAVRGAGRRRDADSRDELLPVVVAVLGIARASWSCTSTAPGGSGICSRREPPAAFPETCCCASCGAFEKRATFSRGPRGRPRFEGVAGRLLRCDARPCST